MVNEQAQAAPAPSGDDLEKWIADRRRPLSAGLLGLAALLAALTIVQAVFQFRNKTGNIPVGVWAAALALLCLFGGLYLLFEQGAARPSGGEGRYRLLALAL